MQPLQSTKRNAIVLVYVGLYTILAHCPPLLLSSSEDNDDNNNDDNKEGEGEEGKEEAQELDIDLDQDKDGDNDNDDTGLVSPDIQQLTQEPLDKEVGFKTVNRRVI